MEDKHVKIRLKDIAGFVIGALITWFVIWMFL